MERFGRFGRSGMDNYIEKRQLQQELINTKYSRDTSAEKYITVFYSDFEKFIEHKKRKKITTNWLKKIERFFTKEFVNFMKENHPTLVHKNTGQTYFIINRTVLIKLLEHLYEKYSYSSYEKYYHMVFDFIRFYRNMLENIDGIEFENASSLLSMKDSFSLNNLVSQTELRKERERRTIKDVSLKDIKKSIETILSLYFSKEVTKNLLLASTTAYVVLSTTGMRFSDLQNLKMNDINLEKREIMAWNNKVGVREVYFLTKEAANLLELCIEKYSDDEKLCIEKYSDDKKVFTYTRLDEMLYRVRRKLYGVDILKLSKVAPNAIIKKLYPIQLKFTKKAYANQLLKAGVTEPYLSILTHHRRKEQPIAVQQTLYNHYLNTNPLDDKELKKILRREWEKAFKDVKLLPPYFWRIFL